ncbi:MAG TPA: vitamin K epoxide reductase family protein [Gemmatimonadales bacterium]|nr:vitamin K epoxide reductase family protein [Gemmatimonadales bacterium]
MRRRQVIALLALVGFCIALYLWFYKIGVIGKLQCGSGSCEYVQTSRYGALFGVPVALYGVAGYAVIFAVAMVGLQPSQLARRWPTTALALLSAGGFLFTLYLTGIELFVLHAICRWCVGSAVVMSAIAAVAVEGAVRRR